MNCSGDELGTGIALTIVKGCLLLGAILVGVIVLGYVFIKRILL